MSKPVATWINDGGSVTWPLDCFDRRIWVGSLAVLLLGSIVAVLLVTAAINIELDAVLLSMVASCIILVGERLVRLLVWVVDNSIDIFASGGSALHLAIVRSIGSKTIALPFLSNFNRGRYGQSIFYQVSTDRFFITLVLGGREKSEPPSFESRLRRRSSSTSITLVFFLSIIVFSFRPNLVVRV
jgi:hypothetical protein